jgi:hypothetical protein
MGVGNYHGVYFFRIESEMPVHGIRIRPMPLKHPTFKENFFPGKGFYQVLGTGNGLSGAMEGNFHEKKLNGKYSDNGRGAC